MATKRWTRADACVVVEELEASGLTIAAFCERRGLSYERLRKWRSRLRQEAAVAPARLVELVAYPPETVTRLAVRCPSGHRIELENVELVSGLRLVLAAVAELGRC